MAKQKVELVEATIEDLARYLTAIGKDDFEKIGEGDTQEAKQQKQHDRVQDAAREDGKHFIQSANTLRQYIGKVRGSLGWTKKRNKSDNTSSTGKREATINDLKEAQKFASKMKMTPTALLALVREINTFGDLATLEECLTTLEELTG